MKQPLNLLFKTTITLLGAVAMLSSGLAQKAKENSKNEFPFDQVGKVTKHEVDTCQVGVNYELHSNVKAPLMPTIHWLVAKAESDKSVLEMAAKEKTLVRVKGTAMVGVENCKWVSVSSAEPVKSTK